MRERSTTYFRRRRRRRRYRPVNERTCRAILSALRNVCMCARASTSTGFNGIKKAQRSIITDYEDDKNRVITRQLIRRTRGFSTPVSCALPEWRIRGNDTSMCERRARMHTGHSRGNSNRVVRANKIFLIPLEICRAKRKSDRAEPRKNAANNRARTKNSSVSLGSAKAIVDRVS